MTKNNKIKKIMYVHYQLSALDGSNTHTSAFIHWFGHLCDKAEIQFNVQSPPLSSKAPPLKKNWLSQVRGILAKYYLRDFRVWLQNKKQKKRELEILKQHQPDIVLTRFERETVSILWACQELNIPVVMEINSPDIEAINAHYRSLPIFKRIFSTPYALSFSRGGFTVTDNLKQQVIDSLSKDELANKPILRTIPNGVNIDKFKPEVDGSIVREELGIAEKSIVIGFVGSFAPWHGIDIIAEVFPKLLEQGYQLHLVLVGQVHQAESNSLINHLINSQYKDKISVTGFIALEKIPNYLAAMDITVLANTEDYCSPLKIFEYMAMGKAVVSVDTEAIRQIMRPGKEGLVFERGNLQAFEKQMQSLIADKEMREKLGEAARKRMVDEFQWKHNAEAVFDLIQDCYHLEAEVE